MSKRIIVLPREGVEDPLNEIFNLLKQKPRGITPVYLMEDPDDTEVVYMSFEPFTLQEARSLEE